MSRTAESSPWRQWRQDQLRELLPPEPPDIDRLLARARNTDATATARAEAMATLLVRVQRWYDEFVSVAAEAGATDGLSAAEILEAAAGKKNDASQPSP